METWKTAIGFPEYEVSDLGRVRRSVTSRQGHKPGRVLKPKLTRYGYYEVRLSVDGEVRDCRINRLVCETFNGPAPDGKPFALHVDDVKTNNIPGNLYWGDRTENGSDAVKNSRYRRGESHPRTNNLTDDQVRAIRQLGREGVLTFKQIGVQFRVSKAEAHRIYTGKSRGHVQ